MAICWHAIRRHQADYTVLSTSFVDVAIYKLVIMLPAACIILRVITVTNKCTYDLRSYKTKFLRVSAPGRHLQGIRSTNVWKWQHSIIGIAINKVLKIENYRVFWPQNGRTMTVQASVQGFMFCALYGHKLWIQKPLQSVIQENYSLRYLSVCFLSCGIQHRQVNTPTHTTWTRSSWVIL
jgi:hypothetical protein